jgi:hypothetical protein
MRLIYLLSALFLFCGFHSFSSRERTAVNPDIINLSALEDFSLPEKPDYSPAYRHTDKNALAIDAAKYKDQYAIAETVFEGQHATYFVELASLQETDGESTYVLYVDDKRVASATNAPTTVDYQPQQHDLGKITIRPGQRLSLAFNSHSNGKIPEDGGFAFSRGRWTGLKLTLHRRR